MKSLSSVLVVGVLGVRLKSADILFRVLCSGVLNKLGRLLKGLSVVGLVKGLSLLVDFLAVTLFVWAVSVVVSWSVVVMVVVVVVMVVVVDGVVAELRLMVLSLLTPSMLDKVTSINLSTENPPDTSVELAVVVPVLDLEILSVQFADCQLSISYLESSSDVVVSTSVLVSVSVATLTASSSSCFSSSSTLTADVTPDTSSWR